MIAMVSGVDAEKALSAFQAFKGVVKKNQVSLAGSVAVAPSGVTTGGAAKKLSDASYPVLESVDWASDIHLKPHPGDSVKDSSSAVDKEIDNDMEGELSPGEDEDNEAAADEERHAREGAVRSAREFKHATHEERMRILGEMAGVTRG